MSNSFATLWTVAHQAPLSMGFSRQEYWSELPYPPIGDLPNPGIEPVSPASPIYIAGGFFTTEPSGKPQRANRKARCLERDRAMGNRFSYSWGSQVRAGGKTFPTPLPLECCQGCKPSLSTHTHTSSPYYFRKK